MIPLDDDGKREWHLKRTTRGGGWKRDTRDLVCILSAGLYMIHNDLSDDAGMVRTIDEIEGYCNEKRYQ